MRSTRLVTLDDADEIARLVRVNREFLAPWEPVRDDGWFTVERQRDAIRLLLDDHEQGTCLPHVILDEAGHVVGRITLSGIVRGPFLSGHLGYFVGADANGRGLATAAVGRMVGLSFDELGLHRVQAATLLHNVRSQGVLRRNGFVPFGVAPTYLRIAGEWQDHLLFQRVSGTLPGSA
ncbi:MAG: GNAT family N-acetyltransferase [Cellulomonas sp.]